MIFSSAKSQGPKGKGLFERFFPSMQSAKRVVQKERPLTLPERQRRLSHQYRRTGSFLTSPPLGYEAPSDRELKRHMKNANVSGQVSFGFVRDLCHMAMGGKINPSALWMPIVNDLLKNKPESSKAKAQKDAVERLNGISSFIRSLNFRTIPGNSPVDKAINVIRILQRDSGNELDASSDGIMLPVLTRGSAQGFSKSVEDVFGDYELLDDDDFALLMADKGPGEKGKFSVDQQREVLEELLSDPLKAQMAKIARTLNSLDKLAIVPVWENVKDPNGDDVNRRRIEQLDELSRIDKQQWAVYVRAPELFWQRVMTHELSVRERVKRSTKKQLLYALIDCSGSMGQENKKRIGTACGVLMNRLKAVMHGEAELFYRFFDGEIYEEHHVKTREEAIAAMRAVMKNNYSGGSTSIDGALNTALGRIDQIGKQNSLIKPQIVIVTDGEDSISLSKGDFGDTVMHAVLCITDNSKLRGLAEKTGGVGLRIDG